MFLHPEYRFCPSNGPIDTSPVEKDRWWKDFNQQEEQQQPVSVEATPPPTLPMEISVDETSTMKAIRAYIARYELGIKSTGPGRSKKNILKDIHHLIEGRAMNPPLDSNVDLLQEDQKESEMNSNSALSAEAFPIPFGGFNASFKFDTFNSKETPIDVTKLEFRWIHRNDALELRKKEISAISLLLCWAHKWLRGGHGCDIETRFVNHYRCTAHKFEDGMFGQQCAGCIVTVHDDMIIGCMMVHRFPLFADRNEVELHLLERTMLDVTMEEMIASSNLSQATKRSIKMKNSYLQIESVSVIPMFVKHYERIINGMFERLFGSYPNDLFIASVDYGHLSVWNDQGFVPFKKQVVMESIVENMQQSAQSYRMLKVTSKRFSG